MAGRTFRAMGCAMEVVVVPRAPAGDGAGIERLLDAAVDLVEQLEERWSRFRPHSELSRLNRAGRADGLSAETFDLVTASLDAWRRTDARFDPTVHDALIAAGYDRTIDEVRAASSGSDHRSAPAPVEAIGVPGPVGIELVAATRSIVLPDGVHLDLGGIGKGRAADLVAALVLDDPVAAGVCANFGGDVRVAGPAPDGGPWLVGIDDPFADPEAGVDLAVVAISDGAVATSTRTRRAWVHDGRPAHHLIDPATGRPADRGLAAVSVVATTAEEAEVIAKAAFVAGADLAVELVEDAGACALIVTDDRAVWRTAGWDDVAAPS